MCSMKEEFLKILQNSQENNCAEVSEGLQIYLNQTLTQVFSCEYCKFFKNNYFEKHLRTAAFDEA